MPMLSQELVVLQNELWTALGIFHTDFSFELHHLFLFKLYYILF